MGCVLERRFVTTEADAREQRIDVVRRLSPLGEVRAVVQLRAVDELPRPLVAKCHERRAASKSRPRWPRHRESPDRRTTSVMSEAGPTDQGAPGWTRFSSPRDSRCDLLGGDSRSCCMNRHWRRTRSRTQALLHESSGARTMPTDRILTCRMRYRIMTGRSALRDGHPIEDFAWSADHLTPLARLRLRAAKIHLAMMDFADASL